MYGARTSDQEEVFCNAVAGETLVPEEELRNKMASYNTSVISLEIIEKVATQFSVSKEVIIRRLFDATPPYISNAQYQSINNEIRKKLRE